MDIADIAPTDDNDWGAERMFIAGQSGSGKSTLERRILDYLWRKDKANKRRLQVVIDSKHDWNYRQWFKLGGGEDVWRPLPMTDLRLVPSGRYIYRPSYPEIDDLGAHRIFLTSLKRKRCVIVVDEAGDFGSVSPIRSLGKLIREGRSKHVTFIAGSQRPSGIPLLFITEAQKVAVFYLQLDEDCKRMAKTVGSVCLTKQSGYNFYFFDGRRKRMVDVKQTGTGDGEQARGA